MKNKFAFFGTENSLWTILATVFDLILLNGLFLICSLPIVTLGASLSALYSVTLKMARGEESYILRGFFRAWKDNAKQATLLWLPCLAAGLLLYLDFQILYHGGASALGFLVVPLVVLALILGCILLYGFPLTARFRCTMKELLQNIAVLSLKHKAYTLLMLGAGAAVFLFCILASGKTELTLIAVFTVIGFSGLAFLYSLILRQIFDRYE